MIAEHTVIKLLYLGAHCLSWARCGSTEGPIGVIRLVYSPLVKEK